jgi:hypothetical protein
MTPLIFALIISMGIPWGIIWAKHSLKKDFNYHLFWRNPEKYDYRLP